jgi:hypothetical protein
MADTNGHNTEQNWTPDEFRALRDAMKQPGLVTLKLWPEMPNLEVTLDMSGLAVLTMTGKLVNRMLIEKDNAVKEAGKKVDDAPTDESGWYDVNKSVMDRHDYILGAMVVKPRYYMMDQLKDIPGGRPSDGLCIFDFDPDMRWAILDAMNGGAEAIAKFRDEPFEYSRALAESTTKRIAERLGVATDDTVVDQTAIQSGDLDTGSELRRKGKGTGKTKGATIESR